MGDVLVDAASRHATRRILRQLNGRTVVAHALTHAHPDHQGASHEVCEALSLPLWCGELDADAMETAGEIGRRQPKHPINAIIGRAFTGPPHPVSWRLREGDEVAGFRISLYWAIAWRFLHQPKPFFTPDPVRNRESMRRLAALEPELACFGHGRPLRSPGKLSAFVAKLPRD